MYEEIDPQEPVSPTSLNRHNSSRSFRRHTLRKLADQVVLGTTEFSEVLPELFRYISDPATLFDAWANRDRRGPTASGPDGARYSDFTGVHRWKVCQRLSDSIQAGTYRSRAEREIQLPKSGGTGTRPIVLTSIFDRVVHHAIAGTLGLFVDPKLDPHSCGYRSKRDRRLALAWAEHYTFKHGRSWWVTADIKNAFGSIPIPRLLDIVRMSFPDDRLVELVTQCLHRPGHDTANRRGLRQGSCLSPLLMNLYFDHFIDKPWRLKRPGVSILRYADDLLLLSSTRGEADASLHDLKTILKPTALTLKHPEAEGSIHDLDQSRVKWLGFSIRKWGDRLGMKPLPSAYSTLADTLKRIHEFDNPSVRVYSTIRGWFSQQGPCYQATKRNVVYDRIASLCLAEGFDVIPNRKEAMRIWRTASTNWLGVQAKLTKQLSDGIVTSA